MILEITTNNGRDIYSEMRCVCKDTKYNGTPLEGLITTLIQFSGYNDDYFFNVAYKEPRTRKCRVCEKEYIYQWKTDGVHISDSKNASKE